MSLPNTPSSSNNPSQSTHGPEQTDQDIPWDLVPPPPGLTNADFLAAVSRRVPYEDEQGKLFYQFVTEFSGDVDDAGPGAWKGHPTAWPYQDLVQDPEASGTNTYFVVSSFLQQLQSIARKASYFGCLQAVVLDDLGGGLGGKIPWGRLAGRPRPSYILETSPGSYQVGYIFDTPVYDLARAEALIKSMIYDGLGAEKDPGMVSVTRNVRMPGGVNTKRKYRMADGLVLDVEHAPRCRLVHWDPAASLGEAALIEAFELDLDRHLKAPKALVAPGKGNGAGKGNGNGNGSEYTQPWHEAYLADYVAQALVEAGLPKSGPIPMEGGVWKIPVTCPWVDEHTGGVDDGADYFLGGEQNGGYKCHHGHCSDAHGYIQVREWLRAGGGGPKPRDLAGLAYARQLFGDGPDLLAALPPVEGVWGAKEGAGAGDGAGAGAGFGPGSVTVDQETGEVVDQSEAFRRLRAEVADLRGLSPDEVHDRVRGLFCRAAQLAPSPLQADALVLDVVDATGLGKVAVKAEMTAWIKHLTPKRGGGMPAPTGDVLDPVILVTDWAARDDTGNVVAVTRNLEVVLRAMGAWVWWDEMAHDIRLAGALEGQTLDDAVKILLNCCLRNGNARATKGGIADDLFLLAGRNRSHPFGDFLRGLVEVGDWGPVDRFEQLVQTVELQVAEGEDEEEVRSLLRLILRRWLNSVVAAALGLYIGKPGEQPRTVMVFNGAQFSGKTTWLSRLFSGLYPGADKCFMGGAEFTGDRDNRDQLLSHLVVELGELDYTTGKTQSGKLKAFLSGDVDSIRGLFKLKHTDYDRRTVFAATSNEVQFLQDLTGNTRFAVLPLRRANLDAQRAIDMRQLWAQVTSTCLQDLDRARQNGALFERPWLFTSEEVKRIEARTERYRRQSSVEEELLDLFDWDDQEWLKAKKDPTSGAFYLVNPMTTAEVRMLVSGRLGHGHAKNLTDVLRKLTGTPGQKRTTITAPLTKAQRNGRFWPMPPKVPFAPA